MLTKAHILGEIARLAQANSGKVFGNKAFCNETGIREYDWGKYWPRWGDAVREAGLTPNAFSSAHDQNAVLEKLASFTRRLGRFPSQAEMRIERLRDPSFPSDRPLRRVGLKSDLLNKLGDFCAAHTDLNDVCVLLPNSPIPPDKYQTKTEFREHEKEIGSNAYVYLIRSHDLYKIGFTRAPYRRAAEIANQSARGAELIHLLSTDDPVGIERYWHERFADKRVAAVNKQSGEWFSLSEAEVRSFKRRRSFM
jgi:hypothetical protein